MIKKTTEVHLYDNKTCQYVLDFIWEVSLINENGDEVERKIYEKNGELTEIHLVDYSTDGIILKCTTKYVKNNVEDVEENVYDADNRLIEVISSFNDGTEERLCYTYSNEDKVIESKFYLENELISRTDHHYDDHGDMVQAIEYDENGSEISSSLFEYANGQISKESYYVDNQLDFYGVHNINADGKVTASFWYDKLDVLTSSELTIEKSDGSIFLIQNGDKEINEDCFAEKMISDKNDLLIKSVVITEDGVEEVEYNYDYQNRIIQNDFTVKNKFGTMKSKYAHLYEVLEGDFTKNL